MSYKRIIDKARHDGVSPERAMLASVDKVDELAEMLRDEHPELYNRFMRGTHEALYGPHYDEEFAERDVQRLSYTDVDGRKRTGPHWTKEEVLSATSGKVFPSGTTDCDRYVAYNAAYADFCKKFDDDDILDIAYLFFFADEDWNGQGKVWKYMNMNS